MSISNQGEGTPQTRQNQNNPFEDVDWVKRLITIPQVVWDEHITRVLRGFKLRFPSKDFDIYQYVDVKRHIAEADPAYRSAIIGAGLDYLGIKLSVDNDGKFTVEVEPNKVSSATEFTKCVMRNRQKNEKYKTFIANSPDRDYLTKTGGIAIRDLRAENENAANTEE